MATMDRQASFDFILLTQQSMQFSPRLHIIFGEQFRLPSFGKGRFIFALYPAQ
jgi:hypothetical protein